MRFSLTARLLKACLLYVCCICSFAIGIAQAQEPTPSPTPTGPIQMVVSSPFASTQKPLSVLAQMGKWFPVAITLSNTGDPVSGEVRLRLTSSTGFDDPPNDFYTQVDLPSNSNKIIWLYGRIERPLVSGFDVTFSGRGFSALTAQATIIPPEEDQRIVLTVADSDDGLAAVLKGLRGQALFRSGGRGGPRLNMNLQPVRALQIKRELVPDRWFGFEGADMVVLGDFAHSTLTPPQIDSIRGFVQGGGNLVVVGGGNSARLATSPLKDLWPMTPKNSAVASAGEVQHLVNRYVDVARNGADRLGGAPVQVVRGALNALAQVKDGSAAQSLFSLLDQGAGRCLFLSYNPAEPPFVGWSGQGNLWKDIFDYCVPQRRLDAVDTDFLNSTSGMAPSYNSQYNGSFNNGGYNSYYPGSQSGPTTPTGQLLQVVARAPQLRMPPVSRIAWFLALYVFFLVPVNYAVLRFIDRRELAWVTIPAIVAVFSFWAYSSALSIRGKAILTRQVDVVQSSLGATSGRDDSLLWLFSPRRTTYNLTSAGQNAAVSDYANSTGTEQGAFSILQPGDASSFKVERAGVLMWTDRAFVAQSIVPLGKGVQLVGNTLSNNTPYTLEGATWVQDRKVQRLGTLQPKESVTVKSEGEPLGADLLGGIGRAGQLSDVFDAFTNSNGIPIQAMTAILGTNFGKLNGEAMLIAWGKTPVANINVEGARSANVTIFLFRMAKLPVGLASREAVAYRTAFEPFQVNGSGQNTPYTPPDAGGYALYNCFLPSQGNLTLKARGMGLYQKGNMPSNRVYQNSTGRYTTPTESSIQFEVKDSRSNLWKPLPGQLRFDSNSQEGGWNFEAKIDRAWARQPDLVLQVRGRLSSQQVQVSSLSIVNSEE